MTKKQVKFKKEFSNPFEPKLGNRFIVYVPNIPSYLIKEIRLKTNEVQIVCYCPLEFPIRDFFDVKRPESIKINWLGPVGDVVDSMTYVGCKMKDIEFVNKWENTDPLTISITYEGSYITSEVI